MYESRQRYIIGAVKIPSADRDVAHAVLPHAGYRDLIDSDDNPEIPLGANVTYSADLTEAEAERFRDASNARYVELDTVAYADRPLVQLVEMARVPDPAADADDAEAEATTRRNDCPNPSLKNNANSCFGGTRTQTTVPAPDGVTREWAYRVTPGNSAILPEYTVAAGQERNHSFYVRANGGTATIAGSLQSYAGSTFVAAASAPQTVLPAGQWVRVDWDVVVAATATRMRTLVDVTGAATSVDLALFLFEQGAPADTPRGYFDGDTPTASWVGTVGNSPSTITVDDTPPPATGMVTIPRASTMAYMGASTPGQYTGAGVRVAVLDGGTSPEVRARQPWTMVAKQNFSGEALTSQGITNEHGCYVTPEAVPDAGELLEAVIGKADGTTTVSTFLQAAVWAADNGAKVVNYSYSAPDASQAFVDGIEYLAARGIQLVTSMGNQSTYGWRFPASYSQVYANVHSSGNFDEATNTRWTTSNYHEGMSGVTSGKSCLSLNKDGQEITWTGTSSSSPKMALLIAMLCTGGVHTPQAAASALRATARDTGQPAQQQGRGAWDLSRAVTLLETPPPVATSGNSGPAGSWHATAPQAIPSGTETPVSFPVEEYPAAGIRQVDAQTYEAVEAGSYTITAAVRYENPASLGFRGIAIGNTLARTATGARRWGPTGSRTQTDETGLSTTVTRRLAAGERFTVWTEQRSGSTDYTQPVVGQALGYVSLTVVRAAGAFTPQSGTLRSVTRPDIAVNGDFASGGQGWATGGAETAAPAIVPISDHRWAQRALEVRGQAGGTVYVDMPEIIAATNDTNGLDAPWVYLDLRTQPGQIATIGFWIDLFDANGQKIGATWGNDRLAWQDSEPTSWASLGFSIPTQTTRIAKIKTRLALDFHRSGRARVTGFQAYAN